VKGFGCRPVVIYPRVLRDGVRKPSQRRRSASCQGASASPQQPDGPPVASIVCSVPRADLCGCQMGKAAARDRLTLPILPRYGGAGPIVMS
jgi:hypothetical protein